jgi:hypothetical protein
MRLALAVKQAKPGPRPSLAACSTVVTSERDGLLLLIKSKLEEIFKTHH